MKVLYIAPLIPAISGSGGKRAVFNHLLDVAAVSVAVDFVCIDVESSGQRTIEGLPSNIRSKIFPRAIGRAGEGIRQKIAGMFQLIASRLPRSVAVVTSPAAFEYITKLVAANQYEYIVVEHLNSFALVRHLQLNAPLIYVAQNVESVVLRDLRLTFSRWSYKYYLTWLEYLKTVWIERALLARADRTVVIGSADFSYIRGVAGPEKTRLWPELPVEKDSKWRFTGSKKLLFVGSAAYFPNRDALNWLIDELLPALEQIDASVKLLVAGTGRDAFPDKRFRNIEFEGFVSDQRLAEMHIECDLFISPVILGAGIKIKVLEAASYGMPIAATEESYRGIAFLSTACCFERESCSTAQLIYALLTNRDQLTCISSATLMGLKNAHALRGPLIEKISYEC
ncbi:glycosyltransferase [Massilia sp. PWRC2]|uniref:glycosyltransferase n=1 Tax=Massilia sp. PWRC2 TaxID=2804626 RepID=UPI003CF9D8A6